MNVNWKFASDVFTILTDGQIIDLDDEERQLLLDWIYDPSTEGETAAQEAWKTYIQEQRQKLIDGVDNLIIDYLRKVRQNKWDWEPASYAFSQIIELPVLDETVEEQAAEDDEDDKLHEEAWNEFISQVGEDGFDGDIEDNPVHFDNLSNE